MLLIGDYTLCYPDLQFTSFFHLTTTSKSFSNHSAPSPNTVLPTFVDGRVRVFKKFPSDILYKSRTSKSLKRGNIQASFKGNHLLESLACYYGEIPYFFQHIVKNNGKDKPHAFTFVRWFNSASPSTVSLEIETMEMCCGYEPLIVESI